MTRREDVIKQLAESMRKGAKREGMFGPRVAEGWSMRASSPTYRVGEKQTGQWILSAKRFDRREPSSDDLAWLAEFALAISGGKSTELERPTVDGYYYFWKDDPS